jgi:hypothetical protein
MFENRGDKGFPNGGVLLCLGDGPAAARKVATGRQFVGPTSETIIPAIDGESRAICQHLVETRSGFGLKTAVVWAICPKVVSCHARRNSKARLAFANAGRLRFLRPWLKWPPLPVGAYFAFEAQRTLRREGFERAL